MQRVMKREAKRIAKKVAKQYPVIKAQNPDYSETEILQKIISNDLNNLSGASEGLRNHIKKCCTSVEGLCYMIAMDMGALKGAMKFRCLQFTRYMDAELYARGFKPQSKETKEALLKELELLIDGWDKEAQTSYVRPWAEKKEKESRYSNELNPEVLFAGFVYLISRFGKKWQSLGEPDKSADNPYSGDSSIFEIGCYVYTNLDLWLFSNKPEMREQLSEHINQQFVDLFSEALPIENVQKLFIERVEKYGEFFRNDEDIEIIHSYLTELIRRTKYDTPPKRADFDNFKLSIDGGLFDEISLKTNLMTFLASMLPAMIEIMENYVSAKEEEKPRKGLFPLIRCIVVFLGILICIIAFLTYLAD